MLIGVLTQNPELRTQNPELRTPNPEPRTPNSEPRTQNPELRTPNSELIHDKSTSEHFHETPVSSSYCFRKPLTSIFFVLKLQEDQCRDFG